MDDRAVAELRDLEARDAELAGSSSQLQALAGEVAALRLRAEEIDAFFTEYAANVEHLRAALDDAVDGLASRRGELEDAQMRLDRAAGDEERTVAQKAVVRAADHVKAAEARLARLAADQRQLEREATALPEELTRLEARASAIAESLTDVPAATGGAAGLLEWASRARASLFVASSQIDTQRDRLIREANELATMLLGEATYGSTPSQALGRVEAALSDGVRHLQGVRHQAMA